MAYALLDDFKLRLGTDTYAELTDRVDGESANDTVGQEVLNGAHGVVNAKIKSSPRRYRVPVDVSSDVTLAAFLKNIVLDIAEYEAWQGWPFRKGIPDRVKDGYRESMAMLNEISAGSTELPGEADVETTGDITGESFGNTQIFGESGMTGF